MKRCLTFSCLCFAWICANGAIWDAVQLMAWGKMFASNVRVATFSVALRDTFDGEKPCAICRAVSKAKQQDEKNTAAPQGESAKGKLVLALVDVPERLSSPGVVTWPAAQPSYSDLRRESVPVRPPRV